MNKPYRKLFADENNELFKTLIADPLLWAVYTICAIRARRIRKISTKGLRQSEFWLAETEYAKFGLKKTQAGQLRRKLMILIRLKVVAKTENRIDNDGATVYRLTSSEPININLEIENEIEKEQRTNRERIEINKKDKNDKKKNFQKKAKDKNLLRDTCIDKDGNEVFIPQKRKSLLNSIQRFDSKGGFHG